MGKVIALTNHKGGVGKTTSTINLAYALSQKGKKVLVVDLDFQASLTVYCGYRFQLEELEESRKTIYWALQKDGPPFESLILPVKDDFSLIPASLTLAESENQLRGDLTKGHTAVKRGLAHIKENYDVILIDCQPSLGILVMNALTAADFVLIPASTDYLASVGISGIITSIEDVKTAFNHNLVILGCIPTMYNKGHAHDDDVLNLYKDKLGEYMEIFPPIRRKTDFKKSSVAGQATVKLFPKDESSKIYNLIADRIIEYV